MKNCTMERGITGVTISMAVIAFVFHLIPFYGMMIGIPIYLVNLISVGLTQVEFDSTDRRLIIWLPLAPIAVWLALALIGTMI